MEPADPADMTSADLFKEQQELLTKPTVKAYWLYSATSLHKREGHPQPQRTDEVERLAAVEHEILRRHPVASTEDD